VAENPPGAKPRRRTERERERGYGEGSERGEERMPRALRRAKRRANLRLRRWMRRHERRRRARRASAASPSVGVFAGLSAPGISGVSNGLSPPDTTGAAGPAHYVEFLNNEIAVYDRATLAPVARTAIEAFVPGADADPQISWDPQGNRFVYLLLGGQGLLWGFSKGADPSDLAGGWCHYTLAEPATVTGNDDYPKLGHSATHVVIGTNINNGATVMARIWALSKPPAGALASCPAASSFTAVGWGDSLNPLRTASGNVAFTAVPAAAADNQAGGWVVASDIQAAGPYDEIMLWRVGGTASAPTLSAEGAFSVAPFGPPPQVPQPGPEGNFLDSMWGQLTQAVALDDPDAGGAAAVWAQHTVSDTQSPRAVVRWYELLPGSLSVRQQGDVSDPAQHALNGAIAPTLAGDAAVIHYNVAGPDLLPEIRARARRGALALGEMGQEITLAQSTPNDRAIHGRWGDYAGASPDPVNPNVVWGTNELSGGQDPKFDDTIWLTRNFALEPLNQAPVASLAATPASPLATQEVALTSTASDADGTIAGAVWDLDSDGEFDDASGPSTTTSFARSGSYTVRLRVTDNDGATGTATKTIAVANHRPSVSAAFAPPAPASGERVELTAAASDPDGSVAALAWDLDSDGQFDDASGPSAATAFARPGTHAVSVRATDDEGGQATAAVAVAVANRAPRAALSVSPQAPVAGQLVSFDGSGSSDADGAIRTYGFDFDGDGRPDAQGPSAVAAFAYPAAGSYRPTLTVYDDFGGAAQTTLALAVGPGANPLAPPPSGAPLPAPRLALSVRAPRALRLARALRLPPRVGVRCSLACSASARLLLDARAARRLGLGSRGAPVVVGRGFVRLRAAAPRRLRLRLARALAGRLRPGARLRLTLAVSARTATGQRRVVNRGLTLRG